MTRPVFWNPGARWQRTRSWNGCHVLGLGVTIERNPMGTTIDAKTQSRRSWTVYNITVHLLTRKLRLSVNTWDD